MSSDAYIRIGGRGVRAYGQTEHHDSLIFVDAPEGRPLTALRHVSYALFSNARTILVRADSPIDSPTQDSTLSDRSTELAEQIHSLDLDRVQHGLLRQPVGEPARIEGSIDDGPGELLDRARAIELEALLHWGEAIWRPSAHHYRLPSGEHAAGFVRVADAIQGPRDAEVLASWLYPYLADHVGIVVDTGTLSALVEALIAAVRSRPGWLPGPVNVLEGYPATRLDVAKVIRDTAIGDGVIALLSVNSSGRLRDHITAALKDHPTVGRSLDVLVDKNEIARHAQDLGGVQMRTWHPRPSAEPLVRYDAESADVCQLCRQASTATLVAISARSFDGRLPGTLARITPSVEDTRRNRTLWEHADTVKGAIRLEAKPDQAVVTWRPPGPMPIIVDYSKLLARAAFRTAAVDALQEQLRRSRAKPLTADLVLMPDHEYELPTRPQLVQAMRPILGENPKLAPFPPRGEWSTELRDLVRKAQNCIVVLSLGVVTGSTLHGALAAVQSARERGPYDLYAYVLHARLADRRAWQTLENSYANQIFAAWHSYLPDRSPLGDEAVTLQGISERTQGQLTPAASAVLQTRGQMLAGEDLDQDMALFWGTAPDSQLTPNSLFGQGLHAPAVYVAVGSAMERARKDQRRDAQPVQRVFELPAIARSYYDPMILSAVLRWLQPHEAWWGTQAGEERSVVQAILNRATLEHQLILVPELLLAAAQGKLNRPGTTVVQAAAASLLASDRLTSDQRAPVELALALQPSYDTPDDEHHQAAGAQSAIQAAKTQRALLELIPGLLRDLRNNRLSEQVITELELQTTAVLERRGHS